VCHQSVPPYLAGQGRHQIQEYAFVSKIPKMWIGQSHLGFLGLATTQPNPHGVCQSLDTRLL
jgi:hypothetical protein